MELSVRYFFRKCNQIRKKLQIWPHLLKKSLMENFIFMQCSVKDDSAGFPIGVENMEGALQNLMGGAWVDTWGEHGRGLKTVFLKSS